MSFSFCRRLPGVSRLAFAISLLFALPDEHALAQSVMHDLPEQIGTDAGYIIYVHGRIVETEGPEAVSDRFGPYDFWGITEALSSRGHVVIAELREPGGMKYVYTMVDQVRILQGAGVPSENITVVRFSKGVYMTLRAAQALREPEVNYGILSCCIAEPIAGDDLSADGLEGRLLSKADSVDDLGFLCTPLFERNAQLSCPISIVFHELTGHGLFYSADPVWLSPLIDWIDAGTPIGLASEGLVDEGHIN